MNLPDKNILHTFDLEGEITPLPGGQNTSVRVQDKVLKPIEEPEHSEWILKIMSEIVPQDYRLSKPTKSANGKFVSKGWTCTQFERGKEKKGNIEEKIRVSRLFHLDLSHIAFENFPQADHPWAKAHRIAWQLERLPENLPIEVHRIIFDLLQKVVLKESYKVQLIHGDLSGNILFDEELPPLIIDFSPTIGPVEYAEAILVCDCIAWQGSHVSDVVLLPKNDLYKEMIIRAVIFRLTVEAIFCGNSVHRFLREYHLFKPIIDEIGLG